MLKQRKPNILKNFNLVYGLKHGTPMPEKFVLECIGTNDLKMRVFAFTPTKKYLSLQVIYIILFLYNKNFYILFINLL